jgi:DNA-binding NarL/FixJ family response regulator/signal transduction histidine kinase
MSFSEQQRLNHPHALDGAEPASEAALNSLIERNRFRWVFIPIFFIAVNLIEPRVRLYPEWPAFWALLILLCTCSIVLGHRMRTKRTTVLNFRLLSLLVPLHCFFLAMLVSWTYIRFGFDQSTLVETSILSVFAVGAMSIHRPNLRILRSVALAYTVVPAITAFWLGGLAGYAVGIQHCGVLIFCLIHGRVENSQFWRTLHAARALRVAYKRQEESAHLHAELIVTRTRQSVIASERARIAAEWHDTLLAGLSAIGWQLDTAQGGLPDNPAQSAKAIEVARKMLKHYRGESRLVIADLDSRAPQPENLKVAIEQALELLGNGRSVAVDVSMSGEHVPLPSQTRQQIIRICHEAVANALQHASPHAVHVGIRNEGPCTIIEVQDDGSGFDLQADARGHYGLKIMRERANRIGSQLEIESELDLGTKVTLRIPVMTSTKTTQTKILLIEDQYFSRLALQSVLEPRSDFKIIAEAVTGAEGVELFRQYDPDVTIVDLRLPDTPGIEVIKALRAIDGWANIVVLSNFDGMDHLRRATEAGAAAYLTKDASGQELIEAIDAVIAGMTYFPQSFAKRLDSQPVLGELTARERDVLEQLVLGLSNRDIGLRLGIAEKTVRAHMGSIFSKLGASDRTQAAVIALQRGSVDPPPDLALHKVRGA